jgi:hypothetical protein
LHPRHHSFGSTRKVRRALEQIADPQVLVITPLENQPLAPLVGTDLRAAATHANFNDGGRPGTFGNCNKSENFDHVLLSPALFAKVTSGAIYRMGAWGGTNGTLWAHYPTLTQQVEAASDHCAVYVDLNIA